MESLPQGLVSASGKVTAELDGIGVDAVDTKDIIQLWKAYSTNPSAHEGDAGFRLQNFFWRIWGSKRLSTSLTGSTLARLFLHISEPTSASSFSYIQRPGPAPAPAPAPVPVPVPVPAPTPTPAAKGSEPLSSSLKRAEKHPEHRDHHPSDPGPGPAHRSSSGTSSKPLQPILKKSNSSSHGETQKTTRLLLTGLGGQSVTRKPSNPPTPIPPSRPIAFGEQPQPQSQQSQQQGSTRASQKKTFSVGSKAKASKRRPVLPRRKSSQQSSFSATSTRNHSPQSGSPPAASKGLDAPWLDDEIDEEAIEDSPEEPTHMPPNQQAISNPPPKSPTTTTTNPQEPPPPNPPTAKERIESLPTPSLPPTFLTDLKTLLHKSTPLPPLRPRNSPPAVGFFSAQACRHYDVRHLSEENYQQSNRSVLVESNFRSKFAEQQRVAEEVYREWWRQYQEQYREQYGCEPDLDLLQGGAQGQGQRHGQGHGEPSAQAQGQGAAPNSPRRDKDEDEDDHEHERPSTGTGTEETVSPTKSRYGDSHPLPHSPSRSHPQSQLASTAATSILASSGIGNPELDPHVAWGMGSHEVFNSQDVFLPGGGGDVLEIETGPAPGQANAINTSTNANTSTSTNASSSAMAVPVPSTGPTNPFIQTPGLSAPRGPSGLSLLISASRNSIASQGQGQGQGAENDADYLSTDADSEDEDEGYDE